MLGVLDVPVPLHVLGIRPLGGILVGSMPLPVRTADPALLEVSYAVIHAVHAKNCTY